MDPVTHGMFGALLGGLGFRNKGASKALVAASLFPDIDLVTRIFGTDAMLLYHRGVTHSIFSIAMCPALIAYIITWKKRGKDFLYFYLLSMLAYAIHVYMDLTTKYGVQLFAPLDSTFYSLYQVFIVDPILSGSLLLFLVLSRKRRQWTLPLSRGILTVIMVYYGSRVLLHRSATDFVTHAMERHAIRNVSPVPGGYLRWWFVASGEDGSEKTGVLDLFLKRVYVHKTYPSQPYTEFMEKSKEAPSVRALLHFSRFPYASQREEAGRMLVRWEDLSFSYLPGGHFIAEVEFGPGGDITKERLRL